MRKPITAALVLGLMVTFATSVRADGVGSITYNVCSPITSVSANGFFNISVTCPADETVVTGGYSCSYDSGANLLPVIVSVNTFYGTNGWQTIGQTLESASVNAHTYACVNNSSGTVKIVPSCTVGTNASPCHANDTCADLSGQSNQPVYSNPTCQVCISCAGGPQC